MTKEVDEELDKYKDEVVDDLVGEELYDVDYLRIHLKYSGEKQKQMRPVLSWMLQSECFEDKLKMLNNQINATCVIMNVQIWVLWRITYLFTGPRYPRGLVFGSRPL